MKINGRLSLLALVAALAAAGCGPNVKVTGKVSRGGQPVNAVKGMHLNLALHPLADPSTGKPPAGPDIYAANVASDGSFDVPGVEGDGIPPGRYRVAVTLRPGRDRSEGKAKARDYDPDKDYLNGAFGPDNSPIVREVKSSQTLSIDLDKPDS